MRYLKKLLEGVEVEWKLLEKVILSLKTGLNPRQNFKLNSSDADGYYVTVREIINGKVVFLDKTDRVNDKALELINNRSNLEFGDILFTGTGTVGRIAVIESTPQNWNIKEGVYAIKPNQKIIEPKFLSYLLGSENIVKVYSQKIVGSPVVSLPMKDLKKLQIPIPCPKNPEKSLEIQKEIVRILDTFTELTAELTTELTTELTARKKQYNYYRDQLLSFEDGEVEWKSLEEVSVKITSGGTPKTGVTEYYGGDIPWLRTQEVDFVDIWDTGVKITELGLQTSSAKMIPANCLIVAMYGATVGRIGINKIPLCTNQACANIQLDEKIANYRFVFHYLSSRYEDIKSLGVGSQTNINASIVKKYKIPIPSLEEQARIVAILDKFDIFTTSITEGLPKEIELRKKQYEYYRDMLLTFPNGNLES